MSREHTLKDIPLFIGQIFFFPVFPPTEDCSSSRPRLSSRALTYNSYFSPYVGSRLHLYPQLNPKPLNYRDREPPTAVPASLTGLLALTFSLSVEASENFLFFFANSALHLKLLYFIQHIDVFSVFKEWAGVGGGGQVICGCCIARVRSPYIIIFGCWWQGDSIIKSDFIFFAIRKLQLAK